MTTQDLSLTYLALSVVLVTALPSAWCAPAAPDIQDGQAKTEAAADWKQDLALQTKVSFESKRQPLVDLLAELQKQTGVGLMPAPGTESSKSQITARVQDLPLVAVMDSLSRLYGVSWKKEGNNYLMSDSTLSALQLELSLLGDLNQLRPPPKLTDGQDLAFEVLKHTTVAALATQEGVALSTMPEELQLRIRRNREKRAAFKLVETYKKALAAQNEDNILHIEAPRRTMQTSRGPVTMPPTASLRTDKGAVIAYIATFTTPINMDTNPNPMPAPNQPPLKPFPFVGAQTQ